MIPLVSDSIDNASSQGCHFAESSKNVFGEPSL